MKNFRLVIVLSLFLTSFNSHSQWVEHSFKTMGTRAHVEFWVADDEQSKEFSDKLINLVTAEMTRLDQSMSPYIESSELSLLNRDAGTKSVTVSKELFSLLSTASYISNISKGAFDITYASIGYQYDYRKKIKPKQQRIDDALSAINYKSISLNAKESTVKFENSAIKIDLGGIAKGYAIKQCINILESAGIQYALMSAGGDTALLGDRNGRPWFVGIKHPRSEEKNAVHIPLSNEAISTSGDYERYFIEDGIRYHHIINPKTGDSARKVVSVSVIGKDATIVDALSTTIFVKGLEQGMLLINSLEGYEAIIIDNNQRLHFSTGLQQ